MNKWRKELDASTMIHVAGIKHKPGKEQYDLSRYRWASIHLDLPGLGYECWLKDIKCYWT